MVMTYRRILVGTDGSTTAAIAERVAGELAAAFGAELVVLTAFDPQGAGPDPGEEVLRGAAERAKELGVEARTELRAGDPADAIMEAAEDLGADLVVVGNKGMGAARRFVLGGVPDRVSHYTPVDLLIVKTTRLEPGKRGASYGKVLIATDGSSTADQAAARGAGVARSVGATITLVYVGDDVMGDIVLRDTAERLGGEGIERRVLKGDPGDRICQVAEEEGHDLIVVGNKGMVGARRFLLEAVPNKVSHEAGCDVLISKTVGRAIGDLRPGEGAIVDVGGQKVAAYVDDDGRLHTVLAKCQHMGCTVGWNSKARTWDCPCHGSRYRFSGEVLNGPTQRPLPPVDVSAQA